MKIDILVFASHPDDFELGCSGTIYKYIKQGYKIAVIDLTMGELSTRGNVKIRKRELIKSSSILGLNIRENLYMKDGFISNNYDNKIKIITKIRFFKPKIILVNAKDHRHPDHDKTNDLLYESCFISGLKKFKTYHNNILQSPWKPNFILYYPVYYFIKPNIVLDITDYMNLKIKSIKAYKSQFNNYSKKYPYTSISSKSFLHSIIFRSIEYGKYINVKYAEGFLCNKILGVNNIFNLI